MVPRLTQAHVLALLLLSKSDFRGVDRDCINWLVVCRLIYKQDSGQYKLTQIGNNIIERAVSVANSVLLDS